MFLHVSSRVGTGLWKWERVIRAQNQHGGLCDGADDVPGGSAFHLLQEAIKWNEAWFRGS